MCAVELLSSRRTARTKRFLFFILVAVLAVSSSYASSERDTPVVKVVKEWAPAVVNISTERIVLLSGHPFWNQYAQDFDPFFQEFYRGSAINAVRLKGVGSGVVLSKEGLIVTNAHVVNMASQIYVIFNNGISVPGHPVYVSPERDIALVKVMSEVPGLKEVHLANPEEIMPGETAVAIGNPFGLSNSVSVGVISAKDRSFTLSNGAEFKDLLQTDASINPGSSGGALLNLDGELMGINLALAQNAQAIAFAISAKTIQEVLKEYSEDEKNSAAQPAAASSRTSVRIPVR